MQNTRIRAAQTGTVILAPLVAATLVGCGEGSAVAGGAGQVSGSNVPFKASTRDASVRPPGNVSMPDGTTVPSGTTDRDASVPLSGDGSVPDGATGDAGEASELECLAVHDVSDCCGGVFAVTRERFEAEPCLLPAFVSAVTNFTPPQECYATDCSAVRCAVPHPGSRLAAPDADGQCELVDECAADADCALMPPRTGICGCCDQVFPRNFTLPKEDPRFVPDCSTADCGAVCAGPPTPFCNSPSAGPRRCVARTLTCAELERQAHDWRTDNAACEEDTDCQLLSFDNSCVPTLLCQVPFSQDVHVYSIKATAASLGDQYEAQCGCAVMDCVDHAGDAPRCDQGRCTFE